MQRSTSLAQRNRSAELYKEKIITAQEMDQATLDFANADASLIKARTNLSIARVRLEDATVRVAFNRPEVRNALNVQVLADIRAALARLRTDDEVGAVVFTGAGEKAFVAGADINQLRHYTIEAGLVSDMQRLYDEVEAFEKPTIAAVNGFALGGGCELAMACDIWIAAEQARFGLPETTLSVLPAAGGTQRLARLVGPFGDLRRDRPDHPARGRGRRGGRRPRCTRVAGHVLGRSADRRPNHDQPA